MSSSRKKHMALAQSVSTNTRAIATGLLSTLLKTSDTDGAFALFEITMRPGGEPPRHAHRERFTLFYILEGEMEIHCDDQAKIATKGTSVLLPPAAFHTYKVLSPRVRFLALMQPGAHIEEYFEKVSKPVIGMQLPELPVRPPFDANSLAALAEEYDFSFDLSDRSKAI